MKIVYPRKLREIIDELKHEGALNNSALSEIDLFIVRAYAPMLLFFIIFFITGLYILSYDLGKGLFVILVAFGVPLMVHANNVILISDLASVFTFGKDKQGRITRFTGSRGMGGAFWCVHFSLNDAPERELKTPKLPRYFIEKDANIDMLVSIASLDRGPTQYMPRLPKLERTFNLRKTSE